MLTTLNTLLISFAGFDRCSGLFSVAQCHQEFPFWKPKPPNEKIAENSRYLNAWFYNLWIYVNTISTQTSDILGPLLLAVTTIWSVTKSLHDTLVILVLNMSHRLEWHQHRGVVTVHGFRSTGSRLQCRGQTDQVGSRWPSGTTPNMLFTTGQVWLKPSIGSVAHTKSCMTAAAATGSNDDGVKRCRHVQQDEGRHVATICS